MRDGEDEISNFKEVYESIFPVLIKVVYHIVGSMEVAEDICQETFIRFYNKNIRFPSLDESRYWLIRVAKNLAFNYYRRREREYRAVKRLRNEKPLADDGGLDFIFKEETEKIVKKALDSLPEKLKSVLVLKEYGGLSYRDIAKVLHISENNVKIRVFRARTALQQKIDKETVHVF